MGKYISLPSLPYKPKLRVAAECKCTAVSL